MRAVVSGDGPRGQERPRAPAGRLGPGELARVPWGHPHIYERLRYDAGDRVLAGDGGFKGRPDASSAVEIGYALVPEYRGRGLATEAAMGLVGWAFSHPEVAAVEAETLPDGHVSGSWRSSG